MNNICKPEEHDWIELDLGQGLYKCKKCGIFAMTDEQWEKILKEVNAKGGAGHE